MTHNGIRGPEADAEGDGHQSHRLALLIAMLGAFSTMFGLVGCGAPAGEPEEATAEPAAAAAAAEDADEDADEQRGLRSNTPEASPGYVIFNPNGSLTTYLVDLEGRVVHMWQSDSAPGGGAYLLDNGHLLRGVREPDVPVFSGGGQGGRLRDLTWEGEVVWDFTFATEDHLLHHDLARLPNGNVLGIAWEQKPPEEANQAGRLAVLTPEAGLWPDMIVEFEPQPPDGARIVWEWHMWDHTIQNHDPDASHYGDPAEHPELIDINGDREAPEMSAEVLERVQALGYVPEEVAPEDLVSDLMHVNAVNYNAALDQIVMSVPRFNEIWVIDHSTTTEEAVGHSGGRWGHGGDLLYRWGNPRIYGRGDEAARRLGFQHDVRWVPGGMPGAGHLTLFNNRIEDADGEHSAVFELVPPTDGAGRYVVPDAGPFGPEEPTWSYVAPTRTAFFSFFISGAHRLANGHTFITSGAQGRFFEVTPEGEDRVGVLDALRGYLAGQPDPKCQSVQRLPSHENRARPPGSGRPGPDTARSTAAVGASTGPESLSSSYPTFQKLATPPGSDIA